MPTNFLSTLCGVLFAACGAGAVAGPGVTVLRSFNNVDGQYPIGRLLYGSDGRIYGTTYGGGAAGLGTAFAVSKDRSFALLHSFNGLDGNSLNSGLIQLANGDLLGSTPQGSYCVGSVCSNFGGSVFTMASDGGGFATLRRFFNGTAEGWVPGTMVDGGDGFFYGTTNSGGALNLGTVFRIAPDGSLGTLHSFNGVDGSYPGALLTRGSDGNFYGSLRYGANSNEAGGIFRIAPGGALTLLHTFDPNTEGSGPSGGLVELDGAFYGVAGSRGIGIGGAGTVFRMYPNGAVTTLKAFNGTDGSGPVGPLALGPDGNLFGLTSGGGLDNGGTIFRIAPGGTFMTLHRLVFADGTGPSAGPIIGPDGLLYGAGTYGGGATGAVGSVFQFDPLAAQPAGLSMSKYCYNEFNTCFRPINTWVGHPYDVIWSSANLGECVASGAWVGRKPPAGRLQFVPTEPGVFTYRLRCTGPEGAVKNAKITVTVG
ncbi:MAG: hypothetical protein IPG91_22115 [Ideonella sp.]|nr:hypothetical protein [Ideonella sp.]